MTTNTNLPNSSNKPLMKRTFHRRPLPEKCIALSSPEGKKLFASAHLHNSLKSFFPLMEQFVTQSEPAYCGISTLVMTLNALAVDPRVTWKGPWRWYEESMLNCCIDLETAKEVGITLGTFVCLAKCQGLQTTNRLASESSIDEFRQAVRIACMDELETSQENGDCKCNPTINQILVVSYSRKSLGQTGSGHFSPIGAYDPFSDYVLILDVARFKYGPHWVPLTTLFEAMLPHDPDTGKSRGYVSMSFREGLMCCQEQLLPQSTLLESITSPEQHLARTCFQQFIQSTKPTFEAVIEFWSKTSIWDLVHPQLIPVDLEQKEFTQKVLDVLQAKVDLYDCVDDSLRNAQPSCRKAFNRMLKIRPVDAMFLLYLASISCKDQRRESLFENNPNSFDSDVNEQILMEAEMIRLALEYSPESAAKPSCCHGSSSKCNK